MIWATFFFALAIVSAALRMGDLAAACGLLAVGIAWRPVAARVHPGKTARLATHPVMPVAGRSVHRGGAASFKPISAEAIRRIAGRSVTSSHGPANGGRTGLRSNSGGAKGPISARNSRD